MINYVPIFLQGDISWWKEGDYFKHPFLLISAYYGRQKPNFREDLEIPKEVTVMGDSGGFQNMTQQAFLDPLSVLKWQERNCNIGFTFDLPILQNDTTEIKIKKQDETVENAYIALNNRKEMALYAIVQGHTYQEQLRILDQYEKMGNPGKFDGWAIGGLVPLAGNTMLIAQILTTFIHLINERKKTVPLHVFGLSGINTMPIMAYLAKVYDKIITFDSSSYASGMIRKDYWLDYGRFSFNIDKNIKLTRPPCPCVVCRNKAMTDFFGSAGSYLITLHNLKQVIDLTKILHSLADDKELLIKYCKSNIVKESIRFIDYTQERGLEKALNHFSGVQQSTGKTHSLLKYRRWE